MLYSLSLSLSDAHTLKYTCSFALTTISISLITLGSHCFDSASIHTFSSRDLFPSGSSDLRRSTLKTSLSNTPKILQAYSIIKFHVQYMMPNSSVPDCLFRSSFRFGKFTRHTKLHTLVIRETVAEWDPILTTV